MNVSISKYFGNRSGGVKRKPPSSSSVSDLESSPEDKKRVQESKKQRQGSSTSQDGDMALQETMAEIQAAMTKLATKEDLLQLAAKEDVSALRRDMDKLVTTLTTRIEKMESEIFQVHEEKDRLKGEVSRLRGENADLQGRLQQQQKEAREVRAQVNDQEQHGRQWNLRVFGVQEAQGQDQETTEACAERCLGIFTAKLGVPVQAADLEIAHRTGKAPEKGGRPRPIIVRFHSRKQRGLVLSARRKLKASGVSVGEDLTQANYKLLRTVSTHSAVLSAWSSNGKILARLKNSKILKVDINTDFDHLFRKEMS